MATREKDPPGVTELRRVIKDIVEGAENGKINMTFQSASRHPEVMSSLYEDLMARLVVSKIKGEEEKDEKSKGKVGEAKGKRVRMISVQVAAVGKNATNVFDFFFSACRRWKKKKKNREFLKSLFTTT